jgi:hypothetical protein
MRAKVLPRSVIHVVRLFRFRCTHCTAQCVLQRYCTYLQAKHTIAGATETPEAVLQVLQLFSGWPAQISAHEGSQISVFKYPTGTSDELLPVRTEATGEEKGDGDNIGVTRGEVDGVRPGEDEGEAGRSGTDTGGK